MTKINVTVTLTPEIRRACGEVFQLKKPKLDALKLFCVNACGMGLESAVEYTEAGKDGWSAENVVKCE